MRLRLWWSLFTWIFWWRLWFWLKAVGRFGFLIHSDFLVEVVVVLRAVWWWRLWISRFVVGGGGAWLMVVDSGFAVGGG